LTDFSFTPHRPARATADEPGGSATATVANRIQPGKRPRSSMAPTLVFERSGSVSQGSDRGRLVMVTGSPGGSAIINYVAKVLVATLQDGLDPLAAIALPNVGSRNGPTELERGRVTPELVAALRARGHETRETDQTSGVQSIVRRCAAPAPPGASPACEWIGAADPRREGTARGR
jgi:gamma-glutamyltranspeptidase/glutathione hydrolase